MKQIDFGQTVTLLANLGVLAGIVFLGIEIRQNSALMRVQINQARADAAMEANSNFFNSDYLPSIVVKIQEGQDLTSEEWLRYVDAFRASNRNQDNVLSQYDAGMLGENTPRSVAAYVCANMSSYEPAREAWEFTKPGFTDRYIAFVEESLARCE